MITESPLVLTDLVTDQGVVGSSITFTDTPAALKPTAELISNIESLVVGETLAPLDLADKLSKRFRLLGTQGVAGMALVDDTAGSGIEWNDSLVERYAV